MTSRKTGRSVSRGEGFWLRAVTNCQQGRQSVRAFCRQRGLAESAYHYWRRILMERGKLLAGDGLAVEPARNPAFPVATFAALELTPRDARQSTEAVSGDRPVESSRAERIELAIGRDRCLRIPCGFDAETLRRLLAVLDGRPC
jgi:hypothetical protein